MVTSGRRGGGRLVDADRGHDSRSLQAVSLARASGADSNADGRAAARQFAAALALATASCAIEQTGGAARRVASGAGLGGSLRTTGELERGLVSEEAGALVEVVVAVAAPPLRLINHLAGWLAGWLAGDLLTR